jgi:hypothetical protein
VAEGRSPKLRAEVNGARKGSTWHPRFVRALRFVVAGLDLALAFVVGLGALWALLWRWADGGLGVVVVLIAFAGAAVTLVAGGLLLALAVRGEQPADGPRLRVVRTLHVGAALLGALVALTDNPTALVLWLPLLGLFAGAGWAVSGIPRSGR